MKKFIFILSLIYATIVNGANYYVATNGNDNNPGTFAQPWATWGKAFTSTSVGAGDTVFIRGGTYNISVTNGSGYNVTRAGTSNNWIVYMNYPGEKPILDCANATPSGQYNTGIGCSTASGANFVKFIGLHVKNLYQKRKDVMVWTYGFACSNGNFTYVNCSVENSEGVGFDSYFHHSWPNVDGYHYFINCDAHKCSNPEVIPGYLPGNNGTGFSSLSFTQESWRGHAIAIKCRAWECGDQGFSWSGEHYCEADSCWSFNNGDLQGDGLGFKCGWHSHAYPEKNRLNVVIKRCVAVYNRYCGFSTNDVDQGYATGMNVYNNLIYHNGHQDIPYVYGIYIFKTPDNNTNELLRIFRNNISFNNAYGDIYVGSGAAYTHSNNSWDGGATITSADFKALPSSQAAGIALLSSPRKPDGSLPDLGDFFQLKEGSDAINAGIDVGLTFKGNAPDLGPFEFSSESTSPVLPVYVNSVVEDENPSQLVMTFSIALANRIPATSAFNVRLNSTNRTVSSVTISGTRVTLNLASPVTYGDAVTVA
ncbi:MAG: hypothetical protein GX800_02545, partial [Clostridiaceae bacterium]|nr:hypothetical protein [Clostridiaceae bacterium]